MVKLDELREELKLLEGFMETKLQKLMDKIDDLDSSVNDLKDKVKPKTYNRPDVDKNASYETCLDYHTQNQMINAFLS